MKEKKESLDKALLNYIFWNSKTDLLEQIKTKDILEDMFFKNIRTSYPLKMRKKKKKIIYVFIKRIR